MTTCLSPPCIAFSQLTYLLLSFFFLKLFLYNMAQIQLKEFWPPYLFSEMPRATNDHCVGFEVRHTDVPSPTHQQLEKTVRCLLGQSEGWSPIIRSKYVNMQNMEYRNINKKMYGDVIIQEYYFRKINYNRSMVPNQCSKTHRALIYIYI